MTEANRLAFDPYGWYNGLYESSCVLLFIDKLRFLLKSRMQDSVETGMVHTIRAG